MKKILYTIASIVALNTLSQTCFAGNQNLISKGASWKYLDNGTDQGTAWQNPSYDDSAWLTGASELGYGDADEATVVSFGPDGANKYITTYFRKTFNVASVSALKSLLLSIRCDDGAVVYINGTEATRYNLPSGIISYNTVASTTIGNQFELNYNRFNIPVSLLVNGANTISVEVHQDDITSSDISFNLELIASGEATIVSQGDVWSYLDNGTDQGVAWFAPAFNDASWLSAKSTLGYSTGATSTKLENTSLSFGPDAANKYATTYFRRNVTIPDTSLLAPTLSARIFIDDGAVIYVNGVEAARVNMPAGAIAYNTFANVTVGTAAWLNITINKNLLHNGTNTFAVEAHQVNLTSSDMFFELEVKEAPVPFATNTVCTNPLSFNCFTAVPASSQTGELVIPSTHTFQYLMKQGDLYTNPIAGITAMPTNNDYTGYLPIAGSSEHGYVAINHENNPGGVSILETTFNQYTGLWEVNNSQPVDYSPVVKSIRNCSGGITPWGTMVSSEEDLTSGDANGDGYQDSGWHVEIDAVTKTIKDQNGDSTPDKLWALGRSQKENICFASDSITSYFGLDAGSASYVYKFVADQPANLSSGTLYVLRQTVFLDNTAFWVQVPNVTQADRNNCQALSTGLGARSFNKVEDVEIGPDGKIYITTSNDSRIYRFSDTPSITDFEIYVQGGNFTYTSNTGVSTGNFANCDNLVFDPEGNLYVNIDGNTNPLWVVRPGHTALNPKIEQFAKPPSGAESTGATFSPDGKYMFVSIQHPSSGNTFVNVDAAGTNQVFNRAYTIVIARKEHLGAQAAIPFVDLGANTSTCQGQPVLLDAGAGHASYAWSTGATTQTISVSTSGTYSVTVTGTNGNTNTDNITVNVNTLPASPSVVSTNYCVGAAILPLSATGTTVKWYSDAALTTQVATGNSFATGNTATGTYTYYATQTDANGCASLSELVTEVINALPASPIVTGAIACATTTIPNLTATGTTIIWYSDASLLTQVGTGNSFATGNTAAGTYTYYATQTDANGCVSATATSSVLTINPQPAAPLSTSQSVCSLVSNPALSAAGSNVMWYSNASLLTQVATGNNFTPTDNAVGIFSYYATETDGNGCVSPASTVTLTINPLPSAPVSLSQTVCEYDVIPSLTATGTTIAWYSDAALLTQVATGNTFNTTNTAPGTHTYYATQTDANGCVSGSTTTSLIINATPVLPVITGTIQYCAGDAFMPLNATGTTIVWYSDVTLTAMVGTGSSFTPSASGTYYATQTATGCVSPSATVTVVVNALPTVTMSGLSASYFSSSPAVTMTGTPTGGTFTGAGVSGNIFTPSVAGVGGPYTITYTFTDVNGCTNTSTFDVTVNIATGVNTFTDGSEMNVFPNPANEQTFVNLNLSKETVVSISVYDATGRETMVINNQKITAGQNKIEINRTSLNLSNGTYWIKVSTESETKTIKTIFQ